jgi:hypothetical protein
MSQQKLDLFNLAAVHVTELRVCSAKIMRSEMIELRPFRTSPNHVLF